MDLTIKEIPEEIIEDVKKVAVVVIERHYKKDLTPSEEKVDAFKIAVDSFLTANGLDKKYNIIIK